MKNVVIIGAGPAGLACALALNKFDSTANITVLNAGSFNQSTAGEHLAAEAVPLLQQLAVPDAVLQENSWPVNELQSQWNSTNWQTNNSIYSAYGSSHLLNRPAFDRALANHAAEQGITVMCHAKVKGIRKEHDTYYIDYINLKQAQPCKPLYANVVIDAAGRNSSFHRSFDAKKVQYDKLIGTSKHYQRSKNTQSLPGNILIKAVENGWWYLADTPFERILIFFSDAQHLAGKHSLNTAFEKELAHSPDLAAFIKECTCHAKCTPLPAQTQLRTKIVDQQMIAIGDAAWSADPLSSQGLLKGITSGMAAAQALQQHADGDILALNRYQQHTRQLFYRYLKERTHIYQSETRWPASNFWQQRHQACWPDTGLNLHPNQLLQLNPSDIDDHKKTLQHTVPSIDLQLLHACAKQLSTATTIVERYKREMHQYVDDREIIIALQLTRTFI